MPKVRAYVIQSPDATATTDLNILHGINVNYFATIKIGGVGAANNFLTGQVASTGVAITNTLDENVADGVVVRVGTIDDSQASVSAAEDLRASNIKNAGNAANLCVFIGYPTATP
tara:strand:- start:239 stop:583 length:345 start_codon:yes stop_codon:yes gene_type:complete